MSSSNKRSYKNCRCSVFCIISFVFLALSGVFREDNFVKISALIWGFTVLGSLGWFLSDLFYNKTKYNQDDKMKDYLAIVFLSFYTTGFILTFFVFSISLILTTISFIGLFIWSGWLFSIFFHKNRIETMYDYIKDILGLILLMSLFIIVYINWDLQSIILNYILLFGEIGLIVWYLLIWYDILDIRSEINNRYDNRPISNKSICPVCGHERLNKNIRICEQCGLDFSKKDV